MKNKLYMIATSVLGLVAIVYFSAFKTADKAVKAENPYIMLEIYEVPKYKDKGIHIHYGGGKREIVPFKEFTSDNHDDNGDLILTAINKLVDQGYVIENTASGLANGGMITKIFMKKK